MGTAIKHPVPDRVKPSFVIFDIRALWRSGSWQQLASLLTLLSWRLDLSCRIFEQINWTEKNPLNFDFKLRATCSLRQFKRWTCSRMTMKFRSLVGHWPCCADKHLSCRWLHHRILTAAETSLKWTEQSLAARWDGLKRIFNTFTDQLTPQPSAKVSQSI